MVEAEGKPGEDAAPRPAELPGASVGGYPATPGSAPLGNPAAGAPVMDAAGSAAADESAAVGTGGDSVTVSQMKKLVRMRGGQCARGVP